MRFRLVLFLSALVAAFSMSAAAALADASLGDKAVANDSPKFRLNLNTLEPGCFALGSPLVYRSVDADTHIDVTQLVKEAHITVAPDANFSIDQVLIPGKNSGYAVYNTFDTGTINNDADIDPDQTATDLAALGGDDVDYAGKIIACVSDHPADQNEPYIMDGLPGEVAALNRPIIQPTIAALGVSAVEPLNTYKLGLGYSVERWYDFTWADAFRNDGVIGPGLSFGDPQGFDTDGDHHADHVFIKSRPAQPGVRRYNDIDEFGEEFSDPHSEKSSYGQPVVFNKNGDPFAYLHKSLPGTVDGGGLFDVWQEAFADQTSALGLLTFTTQGDLPIAWSVKASLAPEAYGRNVALTDDALRQWEADWQAYYAGTGPKPTLPLAPGTNSPAPKPGVIINLPETAPPATTVTNNTVVQPAPVVVTNRCVSGKTARITLAKKARKGNIRYVGAKGARTVKARKTHGRLRAKADFRGLSAERGSYAAVTVREKMKKSGWRERSRLFKLC
jgi:hypothetical protein